MARFVIRRLLLGIPVILGVVAIVFVLARVIPGDPCRAALQEKANAATCAAFNERFGLGDDEYHALFNSTYTRQIGDWKLAVHQQTPF